MHSYEIKQSLRYRVAVALAAFSIFIVGTLCIILYFLSDNIEEAHIKQVIEMEMDHLVRRYQKHSDFNSQAGLHLKSFVIRNMDDELQIPAYLRGLGPGLHSSTKAKIVDFVVLDRSDCDFIFCGIFIGKGFSSASH